MSRRKKFHGGRALLNKPGHHSTAAFVAEILNTDGTPEDERPYYQATFQLANCDRSISLDVDMHSKESRDNTLFKMRKIAQIMNDFLAGLETEVKRADAREKTKKGAR